LRKEKKPKILITGGLGFIFSHVTEYFVQKGWEVVVIDNLSEGSNPKIIDGSFTHYHYHMANPKVVNIIIKENPDYVIHASSVTDVDYSIREPYRTLRKNILSSLHVFEACRNLPNLKKLIYVSTDEVYGECDHKMHEDEIILPKNPYSCAKATGSLIRVAYENTYPTLSGKTAETRFCNVFGPRQESTKIMAAIKRSIEKGYSIPLHEEGKGYREYIYIKNIPPAIDLILEKGLGIFNVTLNDGFTTKELIERVRKVTGKEVKTHPSHRSGMDMKYQMDNSRIKALGWKPLYSFEEGLKEYLLGEEKNK
jgi:nucleoside-diphosphate-sugar epimerase